MSNTPSALQSKTDRSKNSFAKLVPSILKPILKKIFYLILDIKYYLLRDKSEMVPPPSNSGMHNYLEIGQEFFQYFVDLGGLKSTDKVLDIGCATGRMALPLTSYLTSAASYDGFDIQHRQIDWATKNITSQFPNFRFTCVDVTNPAYSSNGASADTFRFPYEENCFDFIFLTSVFTHMLPGNLSNYLREIQRVLKDHGNCLATFFILNKESRENISNGASTVKFCHEIEGCLTDNPEIPEEAIAYDWDNLLGFLSQAGLKIEKPIRYGSWCGRKDFLSYQDIVILSPIETE